MSPSPPSGRTHIYDIFCYPKSGRTHIYDIFFENDHVPETL